MEKKEKLDSRDTKQEMSIEKGKNEDEKKREGINEKDSYHRGQENTFQPPCKRGN